MKAVITLTADASGVQAGVAKAMRHLESLQSAVSQLRTVAFAGMLQNALQGFASNALQELNRLQDLGRNFSAAGMQGQTELAIAQQTSNLRLGEAFGEITRIIDQATVGHIKELTDYLVNNREAIGQAMAAVAGFGMGLADVTAKTLVAFGNLVDYLSNTSLTQMAADAASNVGTGAVQFVAGGVGQGTALIATAEMIYDEIRRKLGGN